VLFISNAPLCTLFSLTRLQVRLYFKCGYLFACFSIKTRPQNQEIKRLSSKIRIALSGKDELQRHGLIQKFFA